MTSKNKTFPAKGNTNIIIKRSGIKSEAIIALGIIKMADSVRNLFLVIEKNKACATGKKITNG
ncbi:hypothetical protein GCM10009118_32690 [Wandonia haliotis]|uniref:Uncharacterized protein n=1 Tax=Wandonia haliotis TaxID=574963 RepID=A0ABN1MV86_9FLAO